MSGLHQVLEAFNAAVLGAFSVLNSQMDSFVEEFSPIADEIAAIQKLKEDLDMVQLLVGATAVFTFEAAVRRKRISSCSNVLR